MRQRRGWEVSENFRVLQRVVDSLFSPPAFGDCHDTKRTVAQQNKNNKNLFHFVLHAEEKRSPSLLLSRLNKQHHRKPCDVFADARRNPSFSIASGPQALVENWGGLNPKFPSPRSAVLSRIQNATCSVFATDQLLSCKHCLLLAHHIGWSQRTRQGMRRLQARMKPANVTGEHSGR